MIEGRFVTTVPVGTEQASEVAEDGDLAAHILDIMEQGVLVWGADGTCLMHNSRVYHLLEISPEELRVGTRREVFRARSVARGEMTTGDVAAADALVRARLPYSFDRVLPSGRVVLTHGRPTRGGGTVVTFTDVTDERVAARELALAKRQAEEAEARAREVLALERARQAEEKMLAQLDEWLQSCKSLDELYAIVKAFMGRLLPGSKGELYIYSKARDVLGGMCNWNTRDLHQSISADSCWSLRRGRAFEFRKDGLCFQCDHVTAHRHQAEVAEYICVPIVAHGDTVGLLHIRFDHLDEGAARIADAGSFAIRCGEHISLAIANAKLRDELRDQSIRDPLTGLYNRRYFLDALRREVAIAERRGASVGLISFDADRFKAINDDHGHDAGDMVLCAIAARMAEIMTAGEVCCRFGGEEFAVLVPGADLAETAALAEKLREAIFLLQVRHLDGVLSPVSISAGVAAYPGSGLQAQEILRRADEALYRAKAQGRNRVVMAEEP
jgi:diguanylate cyclase (GGDEF)-like protein